MAPERKDRAQRREEILTASLALFSQHGLHGVTTKMIAQASGISEALLYKHFRSKEELFDELQRSCLGPTLSAADRLAQMPPSTETLVLAVYFMVREIVAPKAGAERANCVKRLALGSLIDDGGFARGVLDQGLLRYMDRFLASMQAAHKAGDLPVKMSHASLRIWFSHHAACMAANFRLPEPPAADYGVPTDTLVDQLTLFCLRGIGLTQAAIDRCFQPRLIKQVMKSIQTSPPTSSGAPA